MIKGYSEKLKGIQTVSKEVIPELVDPFVDRLYKEGMANGRSRDLIFKHALRGRIIEIAAWQKLGGQLNESEFNFKDPNSFCWDLESESIKFEIKSTPFEHKFFSFNLKNNIQDGRIIAVDMSNVVKYPEYVDYVVTGDIVAETESHYEVRFKHIMNAKNFKNYVRLSKSSNNHFYAHSPAINNGDCVFI